ncbi:glucosaminidase domain-containing protein [Mariprofundus ferrooxydans]|uniref:glucosaminidase domain-containing protein n=1 Tax=Mariprofundus ferrooxydans TaxID=314344 RepID=UPI0003725EF7|nr:glucosaminidase domain-containing protein [Mariprofundus ferrooxydans]
MWAGALLRICMIALLSACSHALPRPQEADKPLAAKASAESADKKAVATAPPPQRKRMGKRAFIKRMKPLVQLENERVMRERRLLIQWRNQDRLTASQQRALQAMAKRYRVGLQVELTHRFWHTMLRRVDMIPLDLVLAQAANESSWGNSRFAREANNYFGQWCFQQGCGVVPLRRDAGAHHEVKRFASAQLSVRAYIRNLNTSDSYLLLRKMRLSMRRSHKPLDADFLAMGLKDYSQRGMRYVSIIRGIVRSNRELVRSL